MIKNKNKIISKLYNFEEVIKYINSNKDKNFENVFKRIEDYLIKIINTFGEKVEDLRLTSLHRLSYQKLDYVFYSKKNNIYYNFFTFESGQFNFEPDKQLLLSYEKNYDYNFQIQNNKSLNELSEDEIKSIKLDFLNNYKNIIIDFELIDNIFKIKETSFEKLTVENYDNDKFLKFINDFYNLQIENNEPYFWLPDDVMGSIGIRSDGSYFIYDLNRIGWYPCDNLNYYYLTRIFPSDTIFHVNIVLNEETDILFIKEYYAKLNDLKIVKKYKEIRKLEKLFEI